MTGITAVAEGVHEASGVAQSAWLLLALPLLGAVVLLVGGRKTDKWGHLIGWYQHKPSAATAAKKAFLMNRVGDVGLAVAIFLLFANLGTTQYTEVFAKIGTLPTGTVLAISLLLLLGACGKSGQFPLQAW